MAGNDIAERVMQMPQGGWSAPVMIAAGSVMSYGALREGMLLAAGWLSGAHGIGKGDRVGLCLPKTLETIQVIAGIHALGAVYVPLPFHGPVVRLNRILASLQPSLLLTTPEMAAALPNHGPSIDPARIAAVDLASRPLAELCRSLPQRQNIEQVEADDLALIYFTSGSTGEPKGVMWSQASMAASLKGLPRWRQQRPDDRLIALAPLQYSASGEIFYPLHSGCSGYVCNDQESLFPDRVAEILERERITVWSAAATALRLLVESGDLPSRDLRHLRRVEMYGERMPMTALRAAMAALPGVSFNNLYAASEAFDMLEYEIPRDLPETMETLPLGRPAPDCEPELRDEADQIVSGSGQVGEICVTGPRIFAGYWNDPVLSQSRRIAGRADTFRTGDLAMRDSDGLYHFVGRRDHQVKLRGHRLDLGEVEVMARRQPTIREAVAIPIGDAADASAVVLGVLVDAGVDEGEVKSALSRIFAERLPRFAWPSRIMVLHEFPRLASGKIDRKAIARLLASE